MRLRHSARKRYLPFIAEEFPHLAQRYEATYANSIHAGESYREGLSQVMGRLCKRYRVRYGRFDDDEEDQMAEVEANGAVDQLGLPFD